jgi:flagellar assembly factor FliW
MPDPTDPSHPAPGALKLYFPFGLIGMRQFTRFALQAAPDSPPFSLLRAEGDESVEFVVMECLGVLDDYAVVLSDEESEALGIRSAEDAIVLNIVTVHSMDPAFVTVNLAGPLVVNRSTLLGQQVILSGHNSYSTEHVLVGQQDVSPK